MVPDNEFKVCVKPQYFGVAKFIELFGAYEYGTFVNS